MPNTANLYSNFSQKCPSRVVRLIVIILLAALLLSACAGGDHTPATEIATQIATEAPAAETTEAPATAEPTQDMSPEAQLPAEIQAQVDHVETLPDGRIVAIEKLSDEDIAAGKKPELRKWQWEAGKSEWISYIPKVGLVDMYSRFWPEVNVDDLPVSELLALMNQERLYGEDGQEIPLGVVGDFSDYTLLCGDVVQTYMWKVDDGNVNIDQVVAVPMSTGDIELFYINGGSPTRVNTGLVSIYDMESVDPLALASESSQWLDQPLSAALTRFPTKTTVQGYWRYVETKVNQNPLRRIVFGVNKEKAPNGLFGERGKFAQGDAFNADGVQIILVNTAIIPPADLPLFP